MKQTWKDLEQQQKDDLIAWFNFREQDLDRHDKATLAKLFFDGRFEAWDCPSCGDRIYRGDPEDWGSFQGVRQVDYVSYPGDETVFQPDYIIQLCDYCRCHGPTP